MPYSRIEELIERIEKHPNNVLDRFVLSKLYYDNKMWEDAIQVSKDILKLKPDYLVVHIQLGHSLIEIGRPAEAKLVLEKAKKLAEVQSHFGMIPEIEEFLEDCDA